MKKKETLTDVPPSEVDQLMEDYKKDGYSVTKTKQADGNFTVVATPLGSE